MCVHNPVFFGVNFTPFFATVVNEYVPSGWRTVPVREPDRPVRVPDSQFAYFGRFANRRTSSRTGRPICEPYVTIVTVAMQCNAMQCIIGNAEQRTNRLKMLYRY